MQVPNWLFSCSKNDDKGGSSEMNDKEVSDLWRQHLPHEHNFLHSWAICALIRKVVEERK